MDQGSVILDGLNWTPESELQAFSSFNETNPITITLKAMDGTSELAKLDIIIKLGDPVTITGTKSSGGGSWNQSATPNPTWAMDGNSGSVVSITTDVSEEITSVYWTMTTSDHATALSSMWLTINNDDTKTPKMTIMYMAGYGDLTNGDYYLQMRGVSKGTCSATSPIIGELKFTLSGI